MRLFKVELGGFEPWMWADHGELRGHHSGWTQQPAHWSLFFFEHEGLILVNNKPIHFREGSFAFVVPGTKMGFDTVGVGTPYRMLSFGLTKRVEVVAIPAVFEVGGDLDLRRKEIEHVFDWLRVSIMPGLAFAFNLLWSVAQPQEASRKSDLVYDAEALIMSRLGEKLKIEEMAAELAISHSHLLRLFRDEHGCTIQEYIREKRVEIARQMITGSDLPLKEIGARTGMSDLQYFNKMIRSSTGLSPRALREMALHRTRH